MKEETIVLHAGHRRDETTTSVAVPIYQTTSYQFNNTEHASKLFSLQELGNIYTRIMNPTCAVLEERMAKLEGGVAAMAVSSGQAASTFSIQNICHSGDNFISSTDLYGGTWNLFNNTMKEMGIECRFVDPKKPEQFENAIDEKTRCIYGETLPNPKLQVFPIEEVGKIGKKHNVPLILDNTAAPYICKPLNHGANIVVYSTTKYIGGHGLSIGGLLIDGGNFDWEKAGDRFKMVANRYKKVRAALCLNEKMAELSREHNNANVLVLGSRLISYEEAIKCFIMFFNTEFEGGRHQARLEKINHIESNK